MNVNIPLWVLFSAIGLALAAVIAYLFRSHLARRFEVAKHKLDEVVAWFYENENVILGMTAFYIFALTLEFCSNGIGTTSPWLIGFMIAAFAVLVARPGAAYFNAQDAITVSPVSPPPLPQAQVIAFPTTVSTGDGPAPEKPNGINVVKD